MHTSIDDIALLPVSPLLARLRAAAPSLQRRVPLQDEAGRWHALRIGDRSHEYVLIFQQCRAQLDLQQAAQLLQAVHAQGLPVMVHGSYAR
ncbi:hypothetical protein ABQG29_05005 [Xanthomonas nasturtii]|nr:hypothetical protein [Xanthomonas nasturtii]WVL54967.1 hypothetical protein M3O59_003335 [Xanthomonas nasturtii]